MQSKIYLYEKFFTEKETEIFSSGTLTASIFKYSSGVEALRIKNEFGNAVLLPFLGQMVWRAEFLGRELTMKSVFDEPRKPLYNYCETYGPFLMHCGLLAMGNPTAEDTHLPHGEIPIAKYDSAYLIFGEDENGKYIGLSGVYKNKSCYELDYEFSPTIKLYEGATYFNVTVDIKNNKDVPLEYYYLCHINHLPVDGAKLEYTADRSKIKVNHEVPENYFDEEGAKNTNAFLDRLDKDPSLMDYVGAPGQEYKPEIVFMLKYDADENGNAYTMQINPDNTSTFVMHKPSELPYALRWITRTLDEQAMGMVLPATAEHFGRLYCQRNNQQSYLKRGESVSYHFSTGLLNEELTLKMKNKIKKMGF